MSAYMVDSSTINTILAALENAEYQGWSRWPKPRSLASRFIPYNNDSMAKLGQQLYELNARGVNARYSDHPADEWGVTYKYKRVPIPSRLQAYKSLQCFLYQCSEGNVPETSQLYKDLDAWCIELAMYIIERLPEYEQYRWG